MSNPKVPPQSLESEQAVLGSILIEPESIIKVADITVPEDFYTPAHRTIFDAMISLYEKHKPLDILTVSEFLKEQGKLEMIGGSSYLAELTNVVTTAAHADHHASVVKEKKVLRDLIRASAEITEGAMGPNEDFESFIDDIEHKILAISQKSIAQNFVPIKDELKSAYERIERLHAQKGELRGVPTGFSGIDSLLSGLQRSDLVILGARPSTGKTSLAMDIARNAAIRSGKKVGVFSLEMSRDQVIDRIISAESGISLWKLRTGRISNDEEFERIQGSLSSLASAPIFIDDTPSPTILQMRAMARRLQVEHGLDLLVVDYLQLIMPRKNSDNTVQQVTEISRGLKGIARELNIPILALSQLSRAVAQRDDKRPQLHDLRESGSIEQDADVVLFIYRKDRNDPTIPPEQQNLVEILIAKHRNGPLGNIHLKFDTETASFKTIDERQGGFDHDLTVFA